MLPDRIRRAVGFTMWLTCFFKFCPFRWDAKAFRFKKGGTMHMVIHRTVILLEVTGFTFSVFRFVHMWARGAEPRPFIMALLFTIARFLEMICYYQFHCNGNDIMYFANQVFAHLDETRIETVPMKKSNIGEKQGDKKVVQVKQKWKWEMTTVCVACSSVLVLGNPPAHALMLVNTPCVPHFLSSIILDCAHDMDDTHKFVEVLPLIILENFLVMSMLQIITFNWTLIFLGSAWAKDELEIVRSSIGGSNKSASLTWANGPHNLRDSKDVHNLDRRESSRRRFRKVQVLVATVNSAFRTYLAASPFIVLASLTLLLFSTIRYSEVDVTSFIMYPLCAARCAFEAFSLLAWAGHVNAMSIEPLQNWKSSASRASPDQKYERLFGKSCRPLSMAAGSYYTFESTIVLTNINVCAENTFNLLVAYP